MPRLFCFGLGFSGLTLARQLVADGWEVAGTTRSAEKSAELAHLGLSPFTFDGSAPLPAGALAGTTHLLCSVPPGEKGDPALAHHASLIANLPDLKWVGYLSTTGVYGDRGGDWVDEDTPVAPDVSRSMRRAHAERAWLHATPAAHIFRLAGIYGPGRSAIDQVRAGTARRIVKPGQVFCRTHVEDIARVVRASMEAPNPGRIYNVCDDLPAPPQDVITHACTLLGVAPPPDIPYDEAALSPMAQSFYADNRRVRNDRIKSELGVVLAYPTYREGLAAIAGPSGLSR